MASNVLGGFDPEVLKFLQDAEWQFANKFTFYLTRDFMAVTLPSTNPLASMSPYQTAAAVLGVPFDFALSQLYVRSVELPTGVTFEYEPANHNKYARAVVYPDSATITFFDDENGFVIRYLKEWERDIAYPDPFISRSLGAAGRFSFSPGGLIFRNNQEYSKRTGMLIMGSAIDERKRGLQYIPMTTQQAENMMQDQVDREVGKLEDQLTGNTPQTPGPVSAMFSKVATATAGAAKKALSYLPQKYPRIMLYGMRPKSLPSLKAGHDEVGNVVYSVEFSIDEISLPLLV